MRVRAAFYALTLGLLLGCKDDSTPPQPKTEAVAPVVTAQPSVTAASSAAPAPAAGIANPASVNCGKAGGKTVIRKDAKTGGERGFCVFPDGSECEEWALFRGTCKQGDSKKPAAAAPKRDPFKQP